MKNFILFLLAISTFNFFGCDDGDDGLNISLDDAGLVIKERSGDFTDIYSSVRNEITSRGFTVVAEIDHSAAASSVGLTLRPTRVIIFGNPQGGTQLMLDDQRIGIDLPLKMLIYENDEGNFNVAYYDGSTLTDRYDVEVETVEDNINTALNAISAGEKIKDPIIVTDSFDDLIVQQTTMSVTETIDSLQVFLMDNGFNIPALVKHDVAAAGVGLDLRPTQVIIFGKPEVGTLLMQSNNQIGIDLPLKILAWEDEDGNTNVGYYNASFLADRHDINDRNDTVEGINAALTNIISTVLN